MLYLNCRILSEYFVLTCSAYRLPHPPGGDTSLVSFKVDIQESTGWNHIGRLMLHDS